MGYTLDKKVRGDSFDNVVEWTRAALADQGFGVLTEIDVKETLKKKINKDIDKYLILGACNPGMAHQAIQKEPRVGAMLPCNVILRQTGDDEIEISAVDPVASMTAIENGELKLIATEVRSMLEKVLASI